MNVNGTAGDDHISVVSSGSSVVVNGLSAQVTVKSFDAGIDSLVVNGGGGNDVIRGLLRRFMPARSTSPSTVATCWQFITGQRRQRHRHRRARQYDVANNIWVLGDDTFVWNPGDGSDTVDGGAGNDTLLFNGSNVAENMEISASGGHAILTRDVGAITMNLDHIENIDVNALGGADTITVDDLSKTDVKNVAIDLATPPGSGVSDGSADTIVINGTNGADTINISESNGVVRVSRSGYGRYDRRLRRQ